MHICISIYFLPRPFFPLSSITIMGNKPSVKQKIPLRSIPENRNELCQGLRHAQSRSIEGGRVSKCLSSQHITRHDRYLFPGDCNNER